MHRFLTLGALAGPLPNNITDGMIADAGPVMANLQSLVDNINDNIGDFSYQVPTTGFSITCAADTPILLLVPAGTLATGAITMPADPVDGFVQRVCSQKIITTLTVSANAGQSILNAPTTVASAGGGFSMLYRSADLTWYRLS